jgi:hypothetical protein
MVTSLQAGRLDFESLQGKEIFLFSETSRLALGAQLASHQWVPGFFPVVKAAG